MNEIANTALDAEAIESLNKFLDIALMDEDTDPEDELDALDAWTGPVLTAYFASEAAQQLNEAEQKYAREIIETFAQLMLIDCGLSPQEWDLASTQYLCTESLTDQLREPEYFTCVSPVLIHFINWGQDIDLLPDHTDLTVLLTDIAEKIPAIASDPNHMGPTRLIQKVAKEQGVDINSDEELDAFLDQQPDEFIEELTEKFAIALESLDALNGDDNEFEADEDDDETWQNEQQPVVREMPKLGQNDPCHCGSGKKYKKCCFLEEASIH